MTGSDKTSLASLPFCVDHSGHDKYGQPIIARTPICQNCSSAARGGHGVSRAESCWVSMWWKPKHITLNPPVSGPHPDQEPHSSATAGSHLQTSLKCTKRANYWLDIGGVSNRNKYYVACSCVRVVQHERTRSSWREGHLESHITHTGEDRKGRMEEVWGCHLWISRMQTHFVCLSAVQHLKDTCSNVLNAKHFQLSACQIWGFAAFVCFF